MDTKLKEALKKAQEEVELAEISEPELKKIAFSKAIDYYLGNVKDHTVANNGEKLPERDKINFWGSLSDDSEISEKDLKDVYSVSGKGNQLLLVLPIIPGDSKADKQRSLAALILYAYLEGRGEEWVTSRSLSEAAQHSNLYDTSRFATNIKKHEWFRSQGVKKGQKYRLSGPGVRAAKDILKKAVNK